LTSGNDGPFRSIAGTTIARSCANTRSSDQVHWPQTAAASNAVPGLGVGETAGPYLHPPNAQQGRNRQRQTRASAQA